MVNQQQMKVLHVAPQPPPLGGMVTYIQGLLKSDVFKELDSLVVKMDYLGKERFTGIIRVGINLLNAILLTVVFVYRVITWRPDVVHIQTNSGFGYFEKSWIALLSKLMGRKTLLHVHGGNFREFYTSAPRWKQKLIVICSKVSDRIVTASPQMRENFLYIGIPDSRIRHINNAVDLPEVRRVYEPCEPARVLFFTRIVLAKGILELIQAVANLHTDGVNITLRIVGAEFPETNIVKDYLRMHGPFEYIEFVGTVTDEQKPEILLNADIFAFPTYIEDQPYAVMEAMAYGLPCIGSNVGAVPSVIQDCENGLLILPKDVASLQNALLELIQNVQLREKYGKAGRATVEQKFSWPRHANQIKSLYLEVLKN